LNSPSLSQCLLANSPLITKHAVVTPFLPLRVFEQYVKFEKSVVEAGYCAGFARDLTVICSGVGAHNVFGVLEALKGTRCAGVMFIGSCGGLGRTRIGDILIAEVCDPSGLRGFREKFEAFLKKGGVVFETSKIYSVESVKDETQALIDNLEKGGFGGVDLETGVFTRVAASNGLNACAALYATDRPLKRPFTEKFTKEEREKIVLARDTVVRNTVAFLEGLP